MLVIVLIAVAIGLVVAIALYAIGREVVLLESRVQPAVFELEEAIAFIADRLSDPVTARVSLDDVRWVLQADAEVLEAATAEEVAQGESDEVLDEDGAVGRVLERVTDERPALADEDVVAILDARLTYLQAIGAVGTEAPLGLEAGPGPAPDDGAV